MSRPTPHRGHRASALALVVAPLLALGCATSSHGEHADPDSVRSALSGREGDLSLAVVPTRYDLHLVLDPAADGYSGEVRIALDVAHDAPVESFVLHACPNLDLQALRIDGAPAAVEVLDAQACTRVVTPADALEAGPATLEIEFSNEWDDARSAARWSDDAGDFVALDFATVLRGRSDTVVPVFFSRHIRVPIAATLDVARGARVVSSLARVGAVEAVPGGPLDAAGRSRLERRRVRSAGDASTRVLTMAVGPFEPASRYGSVDEERVWGALGGASLASLCPATSADVDGVSMVDVELFVPEGASSYGRVPVAAVICILERRLDLRFPFPEIEFAVGPHHMGGLPGPLVVPAFLLDAGPSDATSAVELAHEAVHAWFPNDDVDALAVTEGITRWLASTALEEASAVVGLAHRSSRCYLPLGGRALCLNEVARLGASFEALAAWLGRDVVDRALAAVWAAQPSPRAASAVARALAAESGEAEASILAALTPEERAVDVDWSCAQEGPLVLSLVDDAGTPPNLPVCVAWGHGDARHEACAFVESTSWEVPVDECPTWVHPSVDEATLTEWTLPAHGVEALLAHASDGAMLTHVEEEELPYAIVRGFWRGRYDLSTTTAALVRAARDGTPAWATYAAASSLGRDLARVPSARPLLRAAAIRLVEARLASSSSSQSEGRRSNRQRRAASEVTYLRLALVGDAELEGRIRDGEAEEEFLWADEARLTADMGTRSDNCTVSVLRLGWVDERIDDRFREAAGRCAGELASVLQWHAWGPADEIVPHARRILREMVDEALATQDQEEAERLLASLAAVDSLACDVDEIEGWYDARGLEPDPEMLDHVRSCAAAELRVRAEMAALEAGDGDGDGDGDAASEADPRVEEEPADELGAGGEE